jgi:hypothetical protein
VRDEMECMCMECGISCSLPAESISLEDPAEFGPNVLSSVHVCPACGGQLRLIGRAGDEPFYRLE